MTEENTHADQTVIDAMFRAGAHFGYSRARRHSSVRSHLYGAKNGVDIIDLEETTKMLDTAKAFLAELGKAKKTVIFVGTKREIQKIVEDAWRCF